MSSSSQPRRVGPMVLVASLIAIAVAVGIWRVVDSDGGSPAGEPVTDGVASETVDPDPVSHAQLSGPRLEGIFVSLEAPADEDWTVWLDAPGDSATNAVSAGVIPAGQSTFADPDLGLGTLIDSYDQVLVGRDLQEYEVASPVLSRERVAEIRRLMIRDDGLPGGRSLVVNATDQVGTFGDHARFLTQSLAAKDIAGLRRRAEQLANIAQGDPARDLDADGVAENPGQPIGLLGTTERPGYLPRIAVGTEGSAIPALSTLQEVVQTAAMAARACADTLSVADATECAGAIEQSAEQMDDLWAAVPDAVRSSVVLPLERR